MISNQEFRIRFWETVRALESLREAYNEPVEGIDEQEPENTAIAIRFLDNVIADFHRAWREVQ